MSGWGSLYSVYNMILLTINQKNDIHATSGFKVIEYSVMLRGFTSP